MKKTTKKVSVTHDWKRTVLRLPHDLDDWAAEKAEGFRLSKNAFIVMCIEMMRTMEVLNDSCNLPQLLLQKHVNQDVESMIESAAEKAFGQLKDSITGASKASKNK